MPSPDEHQRDLEELARSAVTGTLGARTRIIRVGTVHAAETSTVLLVTVVHPMHRVVFKAAHRAAMTGTDFARTAAVVNLARGAGVPVAGVLAVDTSYRAGPWQYLLQEQVTGAEWRQVRPLLDEEELQSAHRQIAAAVVAMQSIRFDSFGELDHNARAVGGSLLTSLRRRAELRIRRDHHRQAYLELLDREGHLFSDPSERATLAHDDLHHRNVMFAQRSGRWCLSGILDWDKAWAGPAESDLARMAFWDDMTGPGFWEVYRSELTLKPGHERRRLIYQLLWCLEYDDGSIRHAADTETLLRQLDLTRGDT